MTIARETLESLLIDRREQVNVAIAEELPIMDPERLYEASRYLLDAGGKRLRPTLLFLTAEALVDVSPGSVSYREFPDLDGNAIDVMVAAVSVEIVQSFTLIHDDIMDDDDLRRGVPSVHRAFDLETAILAGDTLYSKAFEILLRTKTPPSRTVRALEALANTCTAICEGQSLDLLFEARTDVTIDEYLEMIELKTAVLFGASMLIPGILLGADEDTLTSLQQFGLDIGRAFQIQDDVLDLTTPSETLGKQRGSDLLENKETLITVHAQQEGVDVDALIQDDGEVSEREIEAAVAELEAAGSIEYAKKVATNFVDSGKEQLRDLPDNEAHDLLIGLSNFLIEREY